MEHQTIRYKIDENVATLTFNRPDRYNAFNKMQINETTSALKHAARDADVRAIVITGAGKAFCAGQDLSEVIEDDVAFLQRIRDLYNPMIMQIRHIEKPIIAAINGAVAGAGLGVALACDLRVISTQATLVFAAFSRIGLVPDNGLTYFLPRLLGHTKALELLLLADAQNRITAEQAVAMGLCTKVVEVEIFEAEVQSFASQLAKLPTRAIGMTKRLLNASWDKPLSEILDMEAQLQEAVSHTADAQEGIQAFLEKREPTFTGR